MTFLLHLGRRRELGALRLVREDSFLAPWNLPVADHVIIGRGRYLATIGRRGGLKSRRTLDPATARGMVAVREARRAFRIFHASCFWSYRKDLKITHADVPWIAEQLMKHGDREAWRVAARLCR
jgi:hypothetical protein